jgi:hypothetical protein
MILVISRPNMARTRLAVSDAAMSASCGAAGSARGWQKNTPSRGSKLARSKRGSLMEALGGRIFLDSPPGVGTSLRVELPLTVTNSGAGPSPGK